VGGGGGAEQTKGRGEPETENTFSLLLLHNLTGLLLSRSQLSSVSCLSSEILWGFASLVILESFVFVLILFL
jgi:hypothetical protein